MGKYGQWEPGNCFWQISHPPVYLSDIHWLTPTIYHKSISDNFIMYVLPIFVAHQRKPKTLKPLKPTWLCPSLRSPWPCPSSKYHLEHKVRQQPLQTAFLFPTRPGFSPLRTHTIFSSLLYPDHSPTPTTPSFWASCHQNMPSLSLLDQSPWQSPPSHPHSCFTVTFCNIDLKQFFDIYKTTEMIFPKPWPLNSLISFPVIWSFLLSHVLVTIVLH